MVKAEEGQVFIGPAILEKLKCPVA